jgi:hypothetical protein
MCKCWADFLPAYAAFKAAAASDPALAAQFASIAGMDSQGPPVCNSPKAAAFMACINSGPKAASNDMEAGCKCWSDFSPTYATLSASTDPKDVSVVAQIAPEIPTMQTMCGNPKVTAFMSCVSAVPGEAVAVSKAASNNMAAGCKCWSDFSPTYATLSASKDPKDGKVLALLGSSPDSSSMITNFQGMCNPSFLAFFACAAKHTSDPLPPCKCWSDFSSTYTTVRASKNAPDVALMSVLNDLNVTAIQKSCPPAGVCVCFCVYHRGALRPYIRWHLGAWCVPRCCCDTACMCASVCLCVCVCVSD